MPIPFLVLDIADLIWEEKDNFESRTSPKCLCSTTCITGKLLKRITGSLASAFLFENINSTFETVTSPNKCFQEIGLERWFLRP